MVDPLAGHSCGVLRVIEELTLTLTLTLTRWKRLSLDNDERDDADESDESGLGREYSRAPRQKHCGSGSALTLGIKLAAEAAEDTTAFCSPVAAVITCLRHHPILTGRSSEIAVDSGTMAVSKFASLLAAHLGTEDGQSFTETQIARESEENREGQSDCVACEHHR